jgi:type II secretion system protein I
VQTCRRLAARVSRAAAARRDRPEGGFTLLEVIVSFVVFAIVAASATAAIVTALQASHGTQQRVDAAAVAQSFIAQAQTDPQSVTAESSKSYPANVKNEDFTVTRTITFSDGTSTHCASGLSFTVHVLVAQAQSGRFLARNDTVVTC